MSHWYSLFNFSLSYFSHCWQLGLLYSNYFFLKRLQHQESHAYFSLLTCQWVPFSVSFVTDSLAEFVTEGTVFFFSHKMQIMSPCLMTFNVAEQPKFDLIMFCLCLFNCSYEFFFLIFKESLYIYLQFYLQYHCELLLFWLILS